MTTLDAIILGLIQGLTEFLPVSSSGHLTLGKALLGITEKGILFEVVVHLGTLLAVATAFWPDIVWLVRGIFALLPGRPSGGAATESSDSAALTYLGNLVLATIPAVLVGLLFKAEIEQAFGSPLLASMLLLVTGGILLLSRLGRRSQGGINAKRSLLIGVSQALAILPGISRSGTTISTGMLVGVEREEAARFSFLMAVPAIAGAFVLQLKDLLDAPPGHAYIFALFVGFVVAYASGLLAIKLLMRVVRRGRFDYFAWYCFAVGALGIYFLRFAG